ncbi:MAG: diacylglycerol kinase [Actinomycetales bacterium]|nr:diacylglycerol kinase [Actinomycetales bacterium]
MSSTALSVLVIVTLLIALAALTLALVSVGRVSRPAATPTPAEPVADEEEPLIGPPVVVYNPSKNVDWVELKRLLTRTAQEVGLRDPVFLETTIEDPGTGQAAQAVALGASVVVAAGGDGTVRSVAAALAGTDTPMGLLPLGTGNLFARNLDLPLADQREMIRIALTGRERPVDVGWVSTELLTKEEEAEALESGVAETFQDQEDLEAHGVRQSPPDKEHVFLVIAGIGFDANMVAGTDDELKSRIGWMAYFVAAVKHLMGRRIDAMVAIGGSQRYHVKARTIMIANCGKLPVGVTLLPNARFDDGWLDIMAVDTRGGIIGWASLAGKIVLQGVGIRSETDAASRIDYKRGRHVSIRTAQPEAVQVDGDLVGLATTMHARVQPSALTVRAS